MQAAPLLKTERSTNLLMQNKKFISVFELALFPMFAALMVASKYVMEILPNIHLIGMFVMLFTVVYRVKALIIIYIFAGIMGLLNGFSVWWVPYLYIWTILWAMTMVIPKNLPKWAGFIIYPIVCSLHGFLYGILYSPFQALAFGYTLEQTFVWIASGFPFDLIHGISNFAMGFLVYPLAEVIKKAQKNIYR